MRRGIVLAAVGAAAFSFAAPAFSFAKGVSGLEAKGTASALETVRALDRDVAVRPRNSDPAKAGTYALEDPLTFVDGRKVATAADWAARRREILGVFAREMYGAEPPKPEAVVTELAFEKVSAATLATLRQYRMWFRSDRSGPSFEWTVWTPRHAKGPVPVILFLNYSGAYELVKDPELPVTTSWVRAGEGVVDHRPTEALRGRVQDSNQRFVFPLQSILARGYAVMTACYADVSPDPEANEKDPRYRQDRFAYTGVFSLWGPRDATRGDNPTALGAWAWALSRGLDLAERLPELDAKRSVVTGFSRLGKAALIAAARDERFAVCVPNQTGGGGVPLAKRDYGETVSSENRMFTHWFCRNYAKYAADPAKLLTFDQHLLLACIAPRALLVEGFEKAYPPWFDPEGEFLSVAAASPVWKFLGGKGLPQVPYPDEFDTSAIGEDLGYVRRAGLHGISGYDWKWMLDFADRALRR